MLYGCITIQNVHILNSKETQTDEPSICNYTVHVGGWHKPQLKMSNQIRQMKLHGYRFFEISTIQRKSNTVIIHLYCVNLWSSPQAWLREKHTHTYSLTFLSICYAHCDINTLDHTSGSICKEMDCSSRHTGNKVHTHTILCMCKVDVDTLLHRSDWWPFCVVRKQHLKHFQNSTPPEKLV